MQNKNAKFREPRSSVQATMLGLSRMRNGQELFSSLSEFDREPESQKKSHDALASNIHPVFPC